MASDIKFNIYHSLTSTGPWTQANESLIDLEDSGHHSYSVFGIEKNTYYYVRIVGGRFDGGTFIPLFSQIIGTSSAGGTFSLDSPVIPAPLEIITASGIDIPIASILSHEFVIDEIV